jgi:DNA-binding protein HU-beta
LRAELAIKRLLWKKKGQAVRSQELISIHHQERDHTMNKSELIEIAAKEADLSKAATEKALAAVLGAVVKAVASGDTVTLVGFGTFKSSKRAARIGRNPQTGKELKIAASTVPRFTAGATFKAAVAGKKAAKKK